MSTTTLPRMAAGRWTRTDCYDPQCPACRQAAMRRHPASGV